MRWRCSFLNDTRDLEITSHTVYRGIIVVALQLFILLSCSCYGNMGLVPPSDNFIVLQEIVIVIYGA